MRTSTRRPRPALLAPVVFTVALAACAVAPAHAQGKAHAHAPAQDAGKGRAKPKHYAVSRERAVSVTRTVLVRQGYEVVRVERTGPTEVVYYRAGNNGRGRGKGPVERLVIRRVEDRVVFEETPPALLMDIDVRLRL
jgi:hypothetical protein